MRQCCWLRCPFSIGIDFVIYDPSHRIETFFQVVGLCGVGICTGFAFDFMVLVLESPSLGVTNYLRKVFFTQTVCARGAALLPDPCFALPPLGITSIVPKVPLFNSFFEKNTG